MKHENDWLTKYIDYNVLKGITNLETSWLSHQSGIFSGKKLFTAALCYTASPHRQLHFL